MHAFNSQKDRGLHTATGGREQKEGGWGWVEGTYVEETAITAAVAMTAPSCTKQLPQLFPASMRQFFQQRILKQGRETEDELQQFLRRSPAQQVGDTTGVLPKSINAGVLIIPRFTVSEHWPPGRDGRAMAADSNSAAAEGAKRSQADSKCRQKGRERMAEASHRARDRCGYSH
ncbi:hypothetical protein CBR_g52017 [Chara braunii]|uniref:Uncharacterized protein n=1 Tax=Chara braunii TaxID=69332 RepID=A0A388M9A5_CHABU|nr:hypothetical protein CBR_g52017 [Chara braunii]|eukprot:GBG91136.1 hypothetical protein CBR_g52017 [Chara braunii]